MGHTGIYAWGNRVRHLGLGLSAVVVEPRIPCVYAWGVSTTVCEYPVSNLSYSVEARHVSNIFVESSDKRKPLLQSLTVGVFI